MQAQHDGCSLLPVRTVLYTAQFQVLDGCGVLHWPRGEKIWGPEPVNITKCRSLTMYHGTTPRVEDHRGRNFENNSVAIGLESLVQVNTGFVSNPSGNFHTCSDYSRV